MNETSVSTTQQTPLGRPTGTSRTQLTPIACFTGVSKSQHHEPMRRCCFNAEMHKRCSEHAGEYVHSHTQMSVAILALSHSFCGRLWHEMSPGLMQTSSVASKHTAVNTPYAAAEQHARSVASEPTGAIAVDLQKPPMVIYGMLSRHRCLIQRRMHRPLQQTHHAVQQSKRTIDRTHMSERRLIGHGQ